nr:unnamed protein product [Digitaria exilis]
MAQVQEGHGVVVWWTRPGPEGASWTVREVLDRADALRLRAVEILQPAQAAELLVAAANMEIGFREFAAAGAHLDLRRGR